MTQQHNPQDLEFIVRLFQSTYQPDDEPHMAIDRIESCIPDSMKPSLTRFKALIESDNNTSLGDSSLYARLLSAAEFSPNQKARLIANARHLAVSTRAMARQFWSGLYPMMIYLSVLSVAALAVIIIYSSYILPGFDSEFHAYEASLPNFTRLVFDNSGLMLAVFTVILLLLIVGVITAVQTRSRMIKLTPLGKLVTLNPLLSELNTVYTHFLYSRLLNTLVNSGLDSTESQDASLRLANVTDSSIFRYEWYRKLQTAAQLGVCEQESEYQAVEAENRMHKTLAMTRSKITLSIQVMIGMMVGALVIAMYLPIFKLGATI